MSSQKYYKLNLRLTLTDDEAASVFDACPTGVDFWTDKQVKKKLIHLLKQDSKDARVLKLNPFSVEKHNKKKVNRPAHKKAKSEARGLKIRETLRKSNYGFAYHRSLYNGLWLNKKPNKRRHFGADMWPVYDTFSIVENKEWREKNPRQAKIEDFKAQMKRRYPSQLLDHTVQFFQKSGFRGPVDFSRLCLLSRAYDYDIPFLYEGRRFSEALLAQFAKDCLEHDLRVIIEDDTYRGNQCRFILIVESNVDLEQAYRFAKSLDKK